MMANKEIEKFLIAKLEHGLKVGKKKLPLFDKFEKLIVIYKDKLDKLNSDDQLLQLRDQLYELSNIMLECRSLASTHKRYTSTDGQKYIWDTRKLLKAKINKVVFENQQISSHPNGTSSSFVSQPYARKSSPAIGELPIYGFEENMKAVRPMVLKRRIVDEFKAIAITGKRGIGKTVLAQLIFNSEEVKSKYSPRIWVCTSKQYYPNDQETDEKTEIVKRILKSLGIEEVVINHVNEKHHVKGLIYLLQLNLKGKRFLIVLDDIWSNEITDWHGHLLGDLFIEGEESSFGDKLSHGLPQTKGGTIIVTTRDDELAEKMVGAKNIYQILPLSNQDDCFTIFTDEISKDGVVRNTTEKLKKELRENCAGIPLAAKVMGQILVADEIKERGQATTVIQPNLTEEPIVPDEGENQEQMVTDESVTKVSKADEIEEEVAS